MPVVGEYHGFFWRAKGQAPAAGGTGTWMYPKVQSVVTLHSVAWGVPGLGRWLGRLWRTIRTLYRLQAWGLTGEQLVVIDRAIGLVTSPAWIEATQVVRTCAHLASFQRPEEWVEFGRALKGAPSQAQNTYRHLWAVRSLQQHATVETPDAHLLVELAYHGYALTAKDGAQHVTRRTVQHVAQVKQWVVR